MNSRISPQVAIAVLLGGAVLLALAFFSLQRPDTAVPSAPARPVTEAAPATAAAMKPAAVTPARAMARAIAPPADDEEAPDPVLPSSPHPPDPAGLQAAIDDNAEGMAACYRAHHDPAVAPHLALAFVIGAGSNSHATVAAPGGTSGMEECVGRIFASIPFEGAEEDQVVTVLYP